MRLFSKLVSRIKNSGGIVCHSIVVVCLLLGSVVSHAQSSNIVNGAIFHLLLNNTQQATGSGRIVLTSGSRSGDTVVFNNVDNAGLNVSIQTDVAISVADQGVLISGFEPSKATVTITFSRFVALQSLTLSAMADSPTFEILNFTPAEQSFTQANGGRWRALPVGSNGYQVDTVWQEAEAATFFFNTNLRTLTFEYTGSPGAGFTIPAFSLQP